MELSQEQQIEYDALVDELVAKGGPTKGMIKACGKKEPEKVARLIELGWVAPGPKGEENEVANIAEIIQQHIGKASMCWENVEGAGVFDNSKANEIAESLIVQIDNFLAKEKATDEVEGPQVKITSRKKKRNIFFSDAVRDQLDRDFLNAEIGKREYKGKLKTVTTIKHYEVIDGEWITDFIIDLKD